MPICETQKYTFVGLPRRGGRYAFAIQRAAKLGGKIAVASEKTRRDILETAKILRLPRPQVIVVKPQQKRVDPSVSLLIFDYLVKKEDEEC